MSDTLRLVRRYEPVLGFSKDGKRQIEAFFPMAVEDYVGRCALWHKGREILAPGKVTLGKLAELGDESKDYFLVYATREALSRIPEQARAQAMARGMTLSRLAGLQEQTVLAVRTPRREVVALQAEGLDGLPALAEDLDPEWDAARRRSVLAGEGRPEVRDEGLNLLYREYQEEEDAAHPRSRLAGRMPVEEQEVVVDLVLLGDRVADLDLPPSDMEMVPYALGLAEWELAERGMDVMAARELRQGLRELLFGATQLGPEILKQAQTNYYGGAAIGSPPVPPTYYYHVIPDHKGYVVLQYWFFYAYNDWGTAHDGLNDHEGDWEGVMIFLRDEDTPEYVAYSRHVRLPPAPLPPRLMGPDTRKWRDRGLKKLYGLHPVVHIGCGSHASYIESKAHVLGLPGVFWVEDHARDNQLRIGPGQRIQWERRVDVGREDWAWFRGHWGVLGRGLRGLGTASPQGPRSKARWDEPVTWAWIPPF